MKTSRSLLQNLAGLAVAFAATAVAAPLKIELPPETAVFKPAAGAEAAMGQCLLCHSAEYVSMQPPLSPAVWKATVEKMQKKFGAPVSPEQVDALVDYLVKGYGAAPAATSAKAGADAPPRSSN